MFILNINPIAIAIGPIKIYWYGIMYLCSFLFFLYGAKLRIKHYQHELTPKLIDDFLFYGVLGVIVGGRIGYCLFYQPAYYARHLFEIPQTWHGGMSFHGGLIGVLVAVYFFITKYKIKYFVFSDFIAPFIPICLMFGRIGNFINGELWGKICTTDIAWCVVFPKSGDMFPRHPSQIYEICLEGILLFIIMIYATRCKLKTGVTSGIFLICYGIIRFIIEFFREPDSFATSVVSYTGISLGQIYSIPMILIGGIICIIATKTNKIKN